MGDTNFTNNLKNISLTGLAQNFEPNSIIGSSLTFTYPSDSVTVKSTSSSEYYYRTESKKSKLPIRMPRETTTYLYDEDGKLNVASYKDGMVVSVHPIIPVVNDIKVINDTVVIVYFADETIEKAVLNKEDTFSLEQGISICLTKKMLSMISEDSGSSVYNKLVEHCLNVYKNNRQAEQDEAQKKIADKEAAKRFKEKLDRKKARKAAEKKEAQIEIQKEAYLRAMREYNGTSAE